MFVLGTLFVIVTSLSMKHLGYLNFIMHFAVNCHENRS